MNLLLRRYKSNRRTVVIERVAQPVCAGSIIGSRRRSRDGVGVNSAIAQLEHQIINDRRALLDTQHMVAGRCGGETLDMRKRRTDVMAVDPKIVALRCFVLKNDLTQSGLRVRRAYSQHTDPQGNGDAAKLHGWFPPYVRLQYNKQRTARMRTGGITP